MQYRPTGELHQLTLVSAFIDVIDLLDDTQPDLRLYKARNRLLHKMLVDECSEELHKRIRREIQEITSPSVRLEVERALYHKLVDLLVICRRGGDARAVETPIPTECHIAFNYTEAWRKDHSGSMYQPGGQYHCDTNPNKLEQARRWFRISGAAGTHLLDTCPPGYSCGSHGADWTDAEMPSLVGVPRQVDMYVSWDGNCKFSTRPLLVMRCSSHANDFVYKYVGPLGCNNVFCGMD